MRKFTNWLPVIVVVVLSAALGLAGCGDDADSDDSGPSTSVAAQGDTVTATGDAAMPTVARSELPPTWTPVSPTVPGQPTWTPAPSATPTMTTTPGAAPTQDPRTPTLPPTWTPELPTPFPTVPATIWPTKTPSFTPTLTFTPSNTPPSPTLTPTQPGPVLIFTTEQLNQAFQPETQSQVGTVFERVPRIFFREGQMVIEANVLTTPNVLESARLVNIELRLSIDGGRLKLTPTRAYFVDNNALYDSLIGDALVEIAQTKLDELIAARAERFYIADILVSEDGITLQTVLIPQ